MRKALLAALAGLTAVAGPVAGASAAPLRIDPALQTSAHASLTAVQYRRWNGGPRYGYRGGPGYYRHGYYGRGNGAAIGAGIAGLAAGAIIGGAIANSQPRAYYSAPANSAIDSCVNRFRSYDVASQTYLGYDGLRHSCP